MSTSKRLQREARWRAIIKRQMSEGVSVAVFCRREGRAVSTFHWWRRRLGLAARERVEWIETEGLALLPAGPAGPAGAVPAVRAGSASGLWIEFAAPPAVELLSAALCALRPSEGGGSC
jgi:hypothetical protein